MNTERQTWWVLLLAALALVCVHAVAQGAPSGTITAVDARTGVATAKINSSGQTFQFTLNNRTQFAQIRVGQPIYVNLKMGQVSLDGKTPSGSITRIVVLGNRRGSSGTNLSGSSTSGANSGSTTSSSTSTGSSSSSSQDGSSSGNKPCAGPAAVIQAAADLVTASGTITVQPQCGSNPRISCDSNNKPVQSTIQVTRKSVTTGQNSAGACAFSASLALATPQSVPVSSSLGSCTVAVNTNQSGAPATESGTMAVTVGSSGKPNTYEVTASNLQISGVQSSDVTVSGGFGCSVEAFWSGLVTDLVKSLVVARSANPICFAVTSQSQATQVSCR